MKCECRLDYGAALSGKGMVTECPPDRQTSTGGRHDPFPPAPHQLPHHRFRCRSHAVSIDLSIPFHLGSVRRRFARSCDAHAWPRSGHTATLLPDGRVLIAGGMRRNRDFYKSAGLYDPATRKFQPAGEMNQRRVGQIAVLLPTGTVLIAGGWIGMGGTDSAELYDPATGKFTVIARMTTPRGRPSATLLTNGDVLIAGGEGRDNESLASAETFHVKTLSFQLTGSIDHARISHTATLLPEGRVLFAGGYADNVESGAELYDPKTGLFTETGSMKTARCKHTAGLLSDGTVLVAGAPMSAGGMGTSAVRKSTILERASLGPLPR